MKSVVFVDDEASVLDGLRRSLRKKRADWDMHFFTNAEDALMFMKYDHIDVVVSDMRMPGMNGAEFLQAVQKQQPKAIRLALSGYADSQLILESAHAIHQHISKPAEIKTIIETVEHSIALQAKLSDPRLQSYVGSLSALPSMPHVYDEIMSMVADDTYTEEEIASVIEKDVGFTATVLRIVNSDFFGAYGNIDSIGQAVSMLGTETLKNIVLSENLFTQFERTDADELERLNVLSKSVSALAHKFAVAAKLSDRARDHCQLAGMVCTMGDMVFLDAGEPGNDISSPVVSAYMLNLWSMPDSLVESVLRHRDPIEHGYAQRRDALTEADCVRAAWFACIDYLHMDDDDRWGREEAMQRTLFALAKDPTLAKKWYDKLYTML
ncbi:MAG: HDOD domain-containing protein [Pseudomonadota bacterium]